MKNSRENLLAIVLGVIFTVAIFSVIFLWGEYFSQTDQYAAQPSKEVSQPTPTPIPTPIPTVTPTTIPTATPTPTPAKIKEPARTYTEAVDHNVPFAAQAPLGHWADLRQEHGCEEASVLMAMKWVNGQVFGGLASAEAELIAIADFEQATYGMNYDTSAKDTVDRIVVGYFGYKKAVIKEDINIEDIKKELYQGNIVIVPVDGQTLGNPNFTPPGPTVHMILVKGYDPNTNEFITNDPGTRRGKNYRYGETVIEESLRDYSTGFEEPIPAITSKVMIVIAK